MHLQLVNKNNILFIKQILSFIYGEVSPWWWGDPWCLWCWWGGGGGGGRLGWDGGGGIHKQHPGLSSQQRSQSIGGDLADAAANIWRITIA